MDASAAENNEGSMRERELEVEIARLNAEIAVLKGGAEPAEVAARFLTMAASTVDQAMADARREADELAAEVAGDAEARRDEANRVAQQVEAQTEVLRTEATNQQAAAEAARHEAKRVTDAATQHINNERARVAEEVERLADVRTALESERTALETYHEELKRRVQELAESMVSFMTTEPPLAAVTAIDELAKPAIAPAAAAVEAAYAAPATAEDAMSVEAAPDVADVVDEPAAESVAPDADDPAVESMLDDVVAQGAEPMADEMPEASEPMDEASAPMAESMPDAPEAPAESMVDATEPTVEASEPVVETAIADPTPFVPVESDPFVPAELVADAEPTAPIEPESDPFVPAEAVAAVEPAVESDPFAAVEADGVAAVEPESAVESDPFAAVEADRAAAVEADPFVATEPEPQPAAPTAMDASVAPQDATVTAMFDRDDSTPETAEENHALFGRANPTDASAPSGRVDIFGTGGGRPTPSFADMMSGGGSDGPDEFGGVPVVDAAEEAPSRRKMGGLFSRVRSSEPQAPVEPVLPEAPPIEGGLFGSQASRLIEQTSPEQLASALADDSEEDERFRSFLDGDGENDPSRDWLLRPDQDD
ncbi:MAG: hypothetical protein AAGA90_18540 [Actinomycetota bacterium]